MSMIKNPPSYSSIENIIVITDCTDIAFNEIYHSLEYELKKHKLSHVNIAPLVSVEQFSIENAAFCIRLIADVVDHKTTLFLVVVHAVKNSPERIFGKTQSGLTFVGNNSGYFNWLLEDFGLESLFINKVNKSINNRSFGGKHVQVPTAIQLIRGTPLLELGEIGEGALLNASFKIKEGTVVHIDNFGLIKIKSPPLTNLTEGEKIDIYVNGDYKQTARYTEKMKQHEDGDWVLFSGSSLYGLPELAKVRSANSAKELSCKIGDVISWK